MEVMLFEVGWVGKASLGMIIEQRPEQCEGGRHVCLWASHIPLISGSCRVG